MSRILKNEIQIRFSLTLYYRKKLPQFNSIEEIFLGLHSELQNKLSIKKIEVQCEGANPSSLYRNLLFVKKHKSEVNHITGHINYAALVLGKRGILTVHDIGSSFYGNIIHRTFIKIFWFWIPALLLNKITVISEFSKEQLVQLIPFAKGKIRVIHNPINRSLIFSPKPFNYEKPLILHIGTKANKNLERTIMALEGIRCELLIIGELTDQQINLLEKHKIEFINKKFIPFSEIKKAYEVCDILSFASLYEGFGMPVIEAQAVGRPVLSSIVSSIPEVAGDGALLVNPKDTLAIREGILKIIEDEQLRSGLIQKGQENVKRFQIDEIANQYLDLYREVANG